jgi:hypothetical protein
VDTGAKAQKNLGRYLLSVLGLAFAGFNLFFALLSTVFPGDLRRTAVERAWLWAFGVLSLAYVAFLWRRHVPLASAALLFLAIILFWLITGLVFDRLTLISK